MQKYNVGWGLTNACNMNCKFCYSKETRKEIRRRNREFRKAKREGRVVYDNINCRIYIKEEDNVKK